MKRHNAKALTLLVAATIFGSLGGVWATQPPPPELNSASAVLIEPGTGQVLYARAADERRPMASLTKMMTGLLVAEAGDLRRTVEISASAAAVGETSMNLTAGEELLLYDLLLGAMLPSANDAAVACAETVSGSLEAFVERMNTRALELGMTGTNFVNPHGLHDDDHYSTARDMATLAVQVMGRAELRPIVRMQEATVPWAGKPYDRTLKNRNQLLAQWDACDGIKTGYTRQAGRCLAASAYQDGWRLICVVMDSKDAWTDAQTLLTWGFDRFYKVALVSRDLTRATVEVRGGTVNTVEAEAAEDVLAVLPTTSRPAEPVLVEQIATAPVQAGDAVGQLSVEMPDGSLRTVELLALEDVARSPWALLMGDGRYVAAMAALVLLAVGVLAHGAVAEAIGARRSR